MAFLRIEKKKSGTYLRIVQSYKEDGKSKHRTLYSLGKAEDYTSDQLHNIAQKLIELAGQSIEVLMGKGLCEIGRYNYGYASLINKLWSIFDLDRLARRIHHNSRVQFDWVNTLKLMIAERLNEPGSKRQCSFNQEEYIGFSDQILELQYFYRTLDLVCSHEQRIKEFLFSQQSNLFSNVLDVVFYDVTTLYFDSQVEQEGSLRKKGYSKDGKAHKTQIVLGLLVDKLRNPISYEIYQGNTYEGTTMIKALEELKIKYKIDQVVVVADSAMIDKDNRSYMVDNNIDYIIGDRLKSMGAKITQRLLNPEFYKPITTHENSLTYTEINYKGRRLICTYSAKRAAKDYYERQKLIDKANMWLTDPSKYNQTKKRGAGRFIKTDEKGTPISIDLDRIKADEKYDGFKAISTTTKLEVDQILSKYRDLFEVEHTFRTLKSQLEIRPMFHWTDNRIRGHITMCFIAYTFLNYTRNKTGLQYKELLKTLDKMQVSKTMDKETGKVTYLRSSVCDNQLILQKYLQLSPPPDATTQSAINQYIK
jgi:transposase